MLFKETKNDTGYKYETEDFVGKFTLQSKVRLDGSMLDGCILKLSNTTGGTGEIKTKEGVIEYEFIKNNDWINE